MNTKYKGDLSVGRAINYYLSIQYEVLLPIGDKKKYDMVIDDGVKILKIQCKYTSFKTEYGIFRAQLKVCGGNSGRKLYHYVKGDFDILFITTSDNSIYIIPFSEIDGMTTSITLGKKWEKFKIK